jgi:ATP phosphoribosyltransferase
MDNFNSNNLIMALPRGRILEELVPLLNSIDIKIEDDFYSDTTRKLLFDTNIDYLKVIMCRSYDAASFVSYGAADIGICGIDVTREFSYRNIYQFCNLDIAKCRLSVAGLDAKYGTKITVATKYPILTRKYFVKKGVNVDIIKLNGSIEVAVKLGLCDFIVDLVSTGNTLKENGLKEIEKICDVSSQLIVNKNSLILKNSKMLALIKKFTND